MYSLASAPRSSAVTDNSKWLPPNASVYKLPYTRTLLEPGGSVYLPFFSYPVRRPEHIKAFYRLDTVSPEEVPRTFL